MSNSSTPRTYAQTARQQPQDKPSASNLPPQPQKQPPQKQPPQQLQPQQQQPQQLQPQQQQPQQQQPQQQPQKSQQQQPTLQTPPVQQQNATAIQKNDTAIQKKASARHNKRFSQQSQKPVLDSARSPALESAAPPSLQKLPSSATSSNNSASNTPSTAANIPNTSTASPPKTWAALLAEKPKPSATPSAQTSDSPSAGSPKPAGVQKSVAPPNLSSAPVNLSPAVTAAPTPVPTVVPGSANAPDSSTITVSPTSVTAKNDGAPIFKQGAINPALALQKVASKPRFGNFQGNEALQEQETPNVTLKPQTQAPGQPVNKNIAPVISSSSPRTMSAPPVLPKQQVPHFGSQSRDKSTVEPLLKPVAEIPTQPQKSAETTKLIQPSETNSDQPSPSVPPITPAAPNNHQQSQQLHPKTRPPNQGARVYNNRRDQQPNFPPYPGGGYYPYTNPYITGMQQGVPMPIGQNFMSYPPQYYYMVPQIPPNQQVHAQQQAPQSSQAPSTPVAIRYPPQQQPQTPTTQPNSSPSSFNLPLATSVDTVASFNNSLRKAVTIMNPKTKEAVEIPKPTLPTGVSNPRQTTTTATATTATPVPYYNPSAPGSPVVTLATVASVTPVLADAVVATVDTPNKDDQTAFPPTPSTSYLKPVLRRPDTKEIVEFTPETLKAEVEAEKHREEVVEVVELRIEDVLKIETKKVVNTAEKIEIVKIEKVEKICDIQVEIKEKVKDVKQGEIKNEVEKNEKVPKEDTKKKVSKKKSIELMKEKPTPAPTEVLVAEEVNAENIKDLQKETVPEIVVEVIASSVDNGIKTNVEVTKLAAEVEICEILEDIETPSVTETKPPSIKTQFTKQDAKNVVTSPIGDAPSVLSAEHIKSQNITDFSTIEYPETLTALKPFRDEGGIIRYSRDFLMAMQPLIKTPPEGLPSMDQLNDDKPQSPRRSGSGRQSSGGSINRNDSEKSSRYSSPSNLGPRGPSSFDFKKSNVTAMGVMPQITLVRTPQDANRSKMGSRNVNPRNSGVPSSRIGSGGSSGYGQGYKGSEGSQRGQSGMWQSQNEPLEKLDVSENAFLPKVLQKNHPKKEAIDEETAAQQEILKKVRSLLNKLTLERFQSLSEKILNIGIDSEPILQGVINLVFDKALDEPTFASMYATLCSFLSLELPKIQSWIDLNTKNNAFRRILLNKCQEEFESGMHWAGESEDIAAAQKRIDELPAEERENLMEKVYAISKAKRRALGNIQFIGELFKRQMLTEKIIHACISHQLRNISEPEEEDIESLCKLMTTVGAKIDHVKAKSFMDAYFLRVQQLSMHTSLSSRIRFMLKDLLDLRVNSWTQRAVVASNGPMKISEIHADIEKKRREEEESQKSQNSRGGEGGSGRGHNGNRGLGDRDRSGRNQGGGRDRGVGNERGPLDRDTWNTVGSRPTPKNENVDVSKFGDIRKSYNSGGSFSLGGPQSYRATGAQGWKDVKKEKEVVTGVRNSFA
ncbi:hypothetical protein HK096_011544 [Nowakowskiella sp. JEL0078]|nr:hypothetical protein HK096_011544 [Nowakowskiella sp. JEL0078]